MSEVQAELDRHPFPIEEPFRELPMVNSSFVELASTQQSREYVDDDECRGRAYLYVQENDGAATFVLVFHEFIGVFVFFFGHFLEEFMMTFKKTLVGTRKEGENCVSYLSELHPLDWSGATVPCKHSSRTTPDWSVDWSNLHCLHENC